MANLCHYRTKRLIVLYLIYWPKILTLTTCGPQKKGIPEWLMWRRGLPLVNIWQTKQAKGWTLLQDCIYKSETILKWVNPKAELTFLMATFCFPSSRPLCTSPLPPLPMRFFWQGGWHIHKQAVRRCIKPQTTAWVCMYVYECVSCCWLHRNGLTSIVSRANSIASEFCGH